jgi:cysteine desulfurase/selenocysteine lyase
VHPNRVAVPEVAALDVARIREDFPILRRRVHGRRLAYLDNAATSQKPESVIEALARFYRTTNANIHRGIHTLAQEATSAYEGARQKVAEFLGVEDRRGVVFTRGTTESLNLVACAWGRDHVRAGDEILLSEMEHHANLVPWIQLAREKGAVLRHIPVAADGTLETGRLGDLLSERTKVVSVTMVSNVLGTINPLAEIARRAREVGALVVLDAAQAVPHLPVDLRRLDCDFLAFSAHKMLGPTGVGVLWGKPEILAAMQPFQSGGEMIREVHLDRATWNDLPWKFEAGTPSIAGVVAFSAALDYLQGLGMEAIREHEEALTRYALDRLQALGGLRLFGPAAAEKQSGVLSFVDPDVHPHDLSTVLDTYGVAIRAGHHCAQPLMRRFGVVATARASFYLYNDRDDVDQLVEGLTAARRYFGVKK